MWEGRSADQYLIVIGLIATYASDAPSDLEAAYVAALQRGLALALERIRVCRTDADLRYLLGSVAAIRGRSDLAEILQDLDAIQETCESCGAAVFPSEPQAAVDRDRAT